MKIGFLQTPFYIGLSLCFIGMLFRMQHWLGGAYLVFAALCVEVIFFVLLLVEVFTSKKANTLMRIGWGAAYIVIPALIFYFLKGFVFIIAIIVIGRVYFSWGRFFFVTNRKELENITFDSI